MADERFLLSYENLKAWCQRANYEFSENTALGQLAIHYLLLEERAPLMIMPHLPRGMVMFAMKQPYQVPAERRAAISAAAGLLNAVTLMGAWVQNHETGELFFRVTVPALDTGYTDQVLLHVSRILVGTSEMAAKALRSIALDGADPTTTIAAIAAPKA